MNIKEEMIKFIRDASTVVGKPMIEGIDFDIVYQPLNHKPLQLPPGKMAVYTFYYNNQFLKIGQANIRSNARYQSQHYSVKSARSTLAKSILNDSSMKDIVGSVDIKKWICTNCERFDVIIDGEKHDKMTLNFVEGLLHYCYKPKYED